MFDPVQSGRLTAGCLWGACRPQDPGRRGVREEASTRAVLWGESAEFAQDRAHEYSAETYTESVYVTSVPDRSRVSPAFGAKPGERVCVCWRAVLWGRRGECGVCAGSRGGEIALGSTRTYTESVYVTFPKKMSAVARGLVPRSAPNPERGGNYYYYYE